MGINFSSDIYYILILFPIIAGAGIAIIPFKNRNVLCVYTEAVTLITSVLSFLVLFNRPATNLEIVSFAGKYPITFGFDGLGSVFGALISFLWPLASLYAFDYMKHETSENSSKESTFFAFYTITFGVTLGIATSQTFLTMYIFYEMLTLVTVPLIIFSLSREAILATRTYLYYSLGGAAFGFITLVFLMNYGGSIDFVLGGVLKPGDSAATLMKIVYLFGFFGFGVKAAVVPLCAWLPKAGVAPTPVTALLHAVAVVKSGAFAILRITYYCFGTALLRGSFAQYIPMAVVIFTIVYGCSQAVRERHFKRRLAYSTVSNLSYILFGCLLMTPTGMTGSLLHMLFHGVMKICSFFCAGAVIAYTGKEYVYELDGLGKRMPITFIAFTTSSFALMGVPGLCGFISKWYLASAAAGSHVVINYIGIGALLISALLTAIYMLQIVIRAYFPEQGFDYKNVEKYHDPGWKMIVPFVVFIVIMLIFGVHPQPIIDLATNVSMGTF